jgi:hypothetical protein
MSDRAGRVIGERIAEMEGIRLVDDAELERLGVLFENREYGDLIFLCDPGTIILPSYMGVDPVEGMHGYHPESECMYSLMMTNGEFNSPEGKLEEMAAFILPGFSAGEVVG